MRMTILKRGIIGYMEQSVTVMSEATRLMASLRLPADKHFAKVFLAGLGAGSRRTMRQALDVMAGLLTDERCDAETLDWSRLRYQHTAAVRSALAERYAPATANKMLSALRGILRECWRLGQMEAEPYQRAVDVESVKGEKLPRGRALTIGEVTALFQALDVAHADARYAAIMALLYRAGLRRGELVTLNREDYEAETGSVSLRGGKGNKDRLAYAATGSLEALNAWLQHRGDEPGPLFWPVNKGGRMQQRRMTDQAVLLMLRKRAAQAVSDSFPPTTCAGRS